MAIKLILGFCYLYGKNLFMKKVFTLVLCLLSLQIVMAQRISVTTDIFGDLQYRDDDLNYKATLRRNVFDALVFTDSKQNKVTYEKKFIDLSLPGILEDKPRRTDMLMYLVGERAKDQKYEAKYSVTIFDKVLIADNRGYRLEQDLDIFVSQGYPQSGMNPNKYAQIHKDTYGNLSIREGRETAALAKGQRGVWSYEDSLGNRFSFARKTWNQLARRYQSTEEIFLYLLDTYFYE